jgi:beta propeller repeat protein
MRRGEMREEKCRLKKIMATCMLLAVLLASMFCPVLSETVEAVWRGNRVFSEGSSEAYGAGGTGSSASSKVNPSPVSTDSAGLTIEGTERRITTDLADQEDPAISSNVICYTDYRGVDYPDVWYYDLATSTEHSATTAAGDQMLTDVSEGIIVYEDKQWGDVFAYSTLTSMTKNVSQDRTAVNPAIGQGWLLGKIGATVTRKYTQEIWPLTRCGASPTLQILTISPL